MAGPYPPPQSGADDQQFAPPYSGQPYPGQPYPVRAGYPGSLPPPVNYPSPTRGGRAAWWALGALAVIGALVAAVALLGGGRASPPTTAFTDAVAKTTIQNYLTALSDADTETVARNNACGMFDAIKDRKSDLSLARLASDAFRKQFAQAEVTSIDKIVPSSSLQAQVLFTMKVAPAATSRKARDSEQGVAQLLRQDGKLLVCSYLLRTAAQY
jgi:hypothetical protein